MWGTTRSSLGAYPIYSLYSPSSNNQTDWLKRISINENHLLKAAFCFYFGYLCLIIKLINVTEKQKAEELFQEVNTFYKVVRIKF